jgi:photosystem II stability/assembly factor-like uncharacterized protein
MVVTLIFVLGCSASASSAGPSSAPTSRLQQTAATAAVTRAQDGVVPVLLARASSSVAYVLARSRGSGSSTELFRSVNAGKSFEPVTAPIARSPDGQPLPVSSITFINPMDGVAIIGTPLQHEPLLVTVNGGRSWHRMQFRGPGNIWAVAGHGTAMYALILTCSRTEPCHDPQLYRLRAGSLRWIREPATGFSPAGSTGGYGFAAYGTRVWLTVGNGQAVIRLLGSVNSGRSFHRELALTAVACGPTASSTQVVWLLCSQGMSVDFQRFVVGTAHARLLPVTGAGTGNTFLTPLSNTIAYFGTALGQRAGLWLSRNAGRSFTRTGRLPGPSAGLSTSVTFLTVRDGLALVPGSQLFRTGNMGASWSTVQL